MQRKVDYLVIGSGIAGLSFALKVADHGKVIIVSKTSLDETNTRYAQGGIASVTYAPDNFEKHVEDTLVAGDGLCDLNVVRMVVEEAPRQIDQLINWGADFDKKSDGTFDLAKEGGHSEHRILHHKDISGYEIQRALVQKIRNHPNIQILENHFAVEIITQHHLGHLVKRYHSDIECYGAYIFQPETRKTLSVLAKVTVMATGGAGNLYTTTTNPIIATGDGVAMVYRAKGIIDNMEFIQFHPTSLFLPSERPSFLITEAMRGFGAILRTLDGNELMTKYDPRGSLAPRDIVARAIDNEMKIRGDDHVYLDATHLDPNGLLDHFPNIYEKCKSIGIDITKNMIPVVPAAHFQCGGIRVNMHGESTINRLYAIGECSCTGLHGANRLASNSLLEAIVYAEVASLHAMKNMIPVVPAAHFQCGGIRVNMHGESTINRLYAIGECSCTGLHGANRLASNSLLEAIVYAEVASLHAMKNVKDYIIPNNIPHWNDEGTSHPEEMVLITQNYKELQQIMTNYVGIVRSNLRLKRALDRLEIIYEETEDLYVKSTLSIKLLELRNMINTGYLVIKGAQARKESVGLHYTLDYPHTKRIIKN